MSDHLRFAGAAPATQSAAFLSILRADPLIAQALAVARGLDLPDWRIVSGALCNSVWNHLTKRPSGHGIKDIDVFHFDAADLTWAAEDVQIRRAASAFGDCDPPVELRNQARVHLWREAHFTSPIAPLQSTDQAIDCFASTTHCVGLRLRADGSLDLYAPFGLDPIFAFRLIPNPALDNRATHERKAARALRHWPELRVIPWPD